MISAAAEARHTLITDAEGDERGFVKVERKLRLGACRILLDQAAIDAYDFEGAFFQVVCLLSVQREDLPGNLLVSDDQRGDRLGPETTHSCQAVPAIGSPENSFWRQYGDHRIKKTARFVDDIGQA